MGSHHKISETIRREECKIEQEENQQSSEQNWQQDEKFPSPSGPKVKTQLSV